MILEQLTKNSFGYYSTDLSPKSHKKIVTICSDCGILRVVKKINYRRLCICCCKKGKLNSNQNQLVEIEPEILWSLYWGLDYKQTEIANLFNCSQITISGKMRKYNIPLTKRIVSDESKEKISKANKGNTCWNKGLTKETNKSLKRISEGMLISNPMDNPESRKKVSESNRGTIPWNKGLTADTDERMAKLALSMVGKVISKEARKKMSIAKKGKKMGRDSVNWKGGITPIYLIIRASAYTQEWRRDILKRDNYICQLCQNDDVIVHHIHSLVDIISSNQIKTMEDALKCDELWDINNGVTVCTECHKKIHKIRDKVILPISIVSDEVFHNQD